MHLAKERKAFQSRKKPELLLVAVEMHTGRFVIVNLTRVQQTFMFPADIVVPCYLSGLTRNQCN
jgi:hypothetical protein